MIFNLAGQRLLQKAIEIKMAVYRAAGAHQQNTIGFIRVVADSLRYNVWCIFQRVTLPPARRAGLII